MYTNTSATVYQWRDGAYLRRVIPAVFWDEVRRANTIKSGMTVKDSVLLMIPHDKSSPLQLTVGKDLVVKGSAAFAFDNSSEQKQAESLRAFRKTHNVLTVTAFDQKLFGSKSMWHDEVSLQ